MNNYVRRQVAPKDMQPCSICHTPSTTVLYNDALKDVLYTCPIHLQDNPSFVTPVHSEEYAATLATLQRLQQQLKAEASKGSGSWDTWVNRVFAKKGEEDKKEEKTEKKEDESTPATLQEQYSQTLDRLTALQQQTRRYKLSDTMFQHRQQARRQQELAVARRQREEANYSNTAPEDLERNFSFPSVPSSDPK